MHDIYDIIAAKILHNNQPKDIDKLAADLRLGLPDYKDLDDTPVNRHKVASKGLTIIRKAIEEMPVVGEPPANVEDALMDFEEDQRDNAGEAMDIVTDEEVDDRKEDVAEESDEEQEPAPINKGVSSVKWAAEATEILLVITDLMGQGHTYEEAKELAEKQVIGARTKGSAINQEDGMKKGQKVFYDTSKVVGNKIAGRLIAVKQIVKAVIAQINPDGSVILTTESGWRLTTPVTATIADKKYILVRAQNDDDKANPFADDKDKDKKEGADETTDADDKDKDKDKEGLNDADDKDKDMDKEGAEADDDETTDDDETKKEGADETTDEDDKEKTSADDDKEDDEDDEKKEGKKTSADIPEASQEGTLGAGNTDDKPEVGMEGGVNVSDHREKGRPDISQEGDVSGEGSTEGSHLEPAADKEVATGTDNVLDNPVIKGKKDRIARLKKLRTMKNRQATDQKQTINDKQTSTDNQRTRLSRNAQLKGLQTKVSQTERNNAVLQKKNRRLESETLADLMIRKGLALPENRDEEIGVMVALSDEGWRQAKRIVEGAPEREPIRISPQQSSRRLLRAQKQIQDGHGVRPGSNKPMQQSGGYLDSGTMFND